MFFLRPVIPAFPSPTTDYPIREAGNYAVSRRDIVLLGALILLTFIPRIIAAVRLGPVCDDGYVYLAVAEALESGEFGTALWYLNINVYPVILVAIARLGCDPLVGAQVWSVLAATATVLPLWGWLRRMLDRRVAFAASGLYAVHPEFIEISAEPIRDATFWLLTASALYFAWRAATERRFRTFASAGLVTALAAHTRSEGWLLILPVAVWPLIRWRHAVSERWRIATGVCLAAAMTPLFLLAFNLTVLREHSQWEWGKLEHFRLVFTWMTGSELAGREQAPQEQPQEAQPDVAMAESSPMPAQQALPSISLEERVPILFQATEPELRGQADAITEFAESVLHALEPVPLLLMLVGSIVGRNLLLRREHLVLSAMCAALLCGVWIRLSTLGEINGRYFLMCFFPAAGSAGIGIIWVLSRVERIGAGFLSRPRAAWTTACLAAAVGAAQVADANTGRHPSREREASIGVEIRRRLGEDRRLVVLPPAARVGHFAAVEHPRLILDDTPVEILLERHSSDVVILEHDRTPREQCLELTTRLVNQGWMPYDISSIPDSEHFLVLTKLSEVPPNTSAARMISTQAR